MNRKYLEITNTTVTCDKEAIKNKETWYDIRGKEKTSSTSEEKKKHVMVMFIFMNAVNTSFIKRTKACSQHRIQPSVI